MSLYCAEVLSSSPASAPGFLPAPDASGPGDLYLEGTAPQTLAVVAQNDLIVTNNQGPTTVTGNHVGSNASCSDNTAFVGGGNTAGGKDTCN